MFAQKRVQDRVPSPKRGWPERRERSRQGLCRGPLSAHPLAPKPAKNRRRASGPGLWQRGGRGERNIARGRATPRHIRTSTATHTAVPAFTFNTVIFFMLGRQEDTSSPRVVGKVSRSFILVYTVRPYIFDTIKIQRQSWPRALSVIVF